MYTLAPEVLSSLFVVAVVGIILGLTKIPSLRAFPSTIRRHPSSDSPKKDIAIKQIYIYPIKSCSGAPVSNAQHTHDGLLYDRTWLIVDAATKKFCTARELPRMVLIRPVINESDQTLDISVPSTDPESASVRTPLRPSEQLLQSVDLLEGIFIWGQFVNGYAVSPEADRLLSDFLGKAVRLVRKGPSARASGPDDHRTSPTLNYQDFYPLTLVSSASISHLQQSLSQAVYPEHPKESQTTLTIPNVTSPKGVNKTYWTPEQLEQLPVTRFRPNIVLESCSRADGIPPLQAWEEDGFCEIEIFDPEAGQVAPFGRGAIGRGKVSILCMARCNRCMVPNIDPKTGVRDNHLPYKLLQQYRQVDPGGRRIGKPAVAVLGAFKDEQGKETGTLSVGDIVRVTSVTNPDTRVATSK